MVVSYSAAAVVVTIITAVVDHHFVIWKYLEKFIFVLLSYFLANTLNGYRSLGIYPKKEFSLEG